MKNKFYLSVLIALLFTRCTSEFGRFNEQAISFISDNKIDKKEYESLINLISESDDNGFKQFKAEKGIIDNVKVVSYLLKYFKSKKLSITIADIWQPETQQSQTKFNINVFLENSASMDGYVKGVTDFENAIYNLLGDFKISGLCDSLNLNYINSKPIAFPPDVQDFIAKLEPSTFQQRGGDRSVSDLKNILKTVLTKVNNKNAAVLISDFVFSPGKNANSQEYLNNQGVGIKIDFAEKLKVYDLSVAIIQLQSNFDGFYYDKNNKPISFNGRRPYYIWVFGSTQQISSILNKKILDNIKGGYSNRFVLHAIKGTSELNYRIEYSPKIGNFSAKQLNKKVITEAVASKEHQNKGLFGFNVALDASSCLQDLKFFSDTGNYAISNNKYRLQIELIKDKNNPSLSNYTHLLKLQTSELREETLKIDIVGKTPGWVLSSTSTDDSYMSNDTNEQQKTFGLKYLVEGVTDAFYPKSNSNVIYTLSVTIKK
jgi:hypothetical protein